jgi:hypothetical protein
MSMNYRINDMTGHSFGRLTVTGATQTRTGSGEVVWRCQCECGGIKNVAGSALRTGKTRSCGCLAKERITILNRKRRVRRPTKSAQRLRQEDGWNDTEDFLSS